MKYVLLLLSLVVVTELSAQDNMVFKKTLKINSNDSYVTVNIDDDYAYFIRIEEGGELSLDKKGEKKCDPSSEDKLTLLIYERVKPFELVKEIDLSACVDKLNLRNRMLVQLIYFIPERGIFIHTTNHKHMLVDKNGKLLKIYDGDFGDTYLPGEYKRDENTYFLVPGNMIFRHIDGLSYYELFVLIDDYEKKHRFILPYNDSRDEEIGTEAKAKRQRFNKLGFMIDLFGGQISEDFMAWDFLYKSEQGPRVYQFFPLSNTYDSSMVISGISKERWELLYRYAYYPDQHSILFQFFPEEPDNKYARWGYYKGPIQYVLYDIENESIKFEKVIEKGYVKKYGSSYYHIVQTKNFIFFNTIELNHQ